MNTHARNTQKHTHLMRGFLLLQSCSRFALHVKPQHRFFMSSSCVFFQWVECHIKHSSHSKRGWAVSRENISAALTTTSLRWTRVTDQRLLGGKKNQKKTAPPSRQASTWKRGQKEQQQQGSWRKAQKTFLLIKNTYVVKLWKHCLPSPNFALSSSIT